MLSAPVIAFATATVYVARMVEDDQFRDKPKQQSILLNAFPVPNNDCNCPSFTTPAPVWSSLTAARRNGSVTRETVLEDRRVAQVHIVVVVHIVTAEFGLFAAGRSNTAGTI